MDTFRVLDTRFLGQPAAIAAGLLAGTGGPALIDPGPTSGLEGLRRALAGYGLVIADLEAVLVTHIHLDHSGGVGQMVRENPGLAVYVHERGAPHLVDPSKLIESATRLYRDQMMPLWGAIVPVPAGNVRPLAGGEHLVVAGREIHVAYTPGHAWHHVSYFDTATKVAAVGDTGGMQIGGAAYLFPPTPPPDIDLEAWGASLVRIAAWHPDRLFVTHFGFVQSPDVQLPALEARLRDLADLVRRSLAEDTTDEARIARYARAVGEDLRRHLSEDEAARFEAAMPVERDWQGLARYWRKRAGATGRRRGDT